MPPKPRITRDMILDAAFEITRESGIDSVNARTIAARLRCSTQPVLYCFKTMDELRRAVFERAGEYHTSYIIGNGCGNGLAEVGEAYVRFAEEEKHLFKLLYQSDHFAQQSMIDLLADSSMLPLIDALARDKGISAGEATELFASRFMLVHGMASLLANNSMIYDESVVSRILRG